MNVILKSTSEDRRLPWWMILIGLALAYSPNYLNRVAIYMGATWDWLYDPRSVLVWNWIAIFLLFVFIVLVERRGLYSIRMTKPSRKDILWALVFWVISVMTSGLVHALFPPPSNGLEIMLALSIPVLVLIVITTSFTEEIFYRGYSIERLRELTGSLIFAVAISFVLFLLPHIVFFGPHWLLYQGLSVVLLYVLYVWRKNLWACMLLHLLGNLMILFPALGLD